MVAEHLLLPLCGSCATNAFLAPPELSIVWFSHYLSRRLASRFIRPEDSSPPGCHPSGLPFGAPRGRSAGYEPRAEESFVLRQIYEPPVWADFDDNDVPERAPLTADPGEAVGEGAAAEVGLEFVPDEAGQPPAVGAAGRLGEERLKVSLDDPVEDGVGRPPGLIARRHDATRWRGPDGSAGRARGPPEAAERNVANQRRS